MAFHRVRHCVLPGFFGVSASFWSDLQMSRDLYETGEAESVEPDAMQPVACKKWHNRDRRLLINKGEYILKEIQDGRAVAIIYPQFLFPRVRLFQCLP